MGVCDAGHKTGSGVESCRSYNRDIMYSKVYCKAKRKDLIENEKAPSGFREVGIVRAPDSCIGFCFGDTIGKVDRLRKKYKRVYNTRNKLDCCLGSTDTELVCDPSWCWESNACDTVIRNYCNTTRGKKDPRCGCLLPQAMYEDTKLLGPPECVDVRCAGNPQAYRIKRQRETKCPDIVNCSIGNITITGTESNIDIRAIEQQCGSQFAEEVQKMLEEESALGSDDVGFLERSANRLGVSSTVLVGGSAVIIILAVIVVMFVMRKRETGTK